MPLAAESGLRLPMEDRPETNSPEQGLDGPAPGAPGKRQQSIQIGIRIAAGILLVAALLLLPRLQAELVRFLPLYPSFGGEGQDPLAWLPQLVPSPTFTPGSEFDQLFVPTPSATLTQPVPPIRAEDSGYRHPQGLFEFDYPSNWSVQTSGALAEIRSQDGRGRMVIQLTDTGNPLDGGSFSRFVTGRESNNFTQPQGSGTIYIPRSESLDEARGTAEITKELHTDGEREFVRSLYRRVGEFIITSDLYAGEESRDTFSRDQDFVWDSLSSGEPGAEGLQRYQWVFTRSDAENGFSVDIPVPWLPDQTRNRSSLIETYHAPDQHAVIQLIRFTTDSELTDAIVGGFVLQLLRDYYTHDVVITSDQIVSNGNEQLSWHSPAGGYRGLTQFRRLGLNTLVILTAVADSEYMDIYQELRQRTMDSFQIGSGTD